MVQGKLASEVEEEPAVGKKHTQSVAVHQCAVGVWTNICEEWAAGIDSIHHGKARLIEPVWQPMQEIIQAPVRIGLQK